jgi:hypothetical protein
MARFPEMDQQAFDPFGDLGLPQTPSGFGPGADPLAPGGFDMGGLGAVNFDSEPAPSEYQLGPDGSMREVTPDEDQLPAAANQNDFNSNLAEMLEDDYLGKLAEEILEGVEEDVERRQSWVSRFRKGLEMMGLAADEVDDGPFPGASTATHPLISEAIVQFWARAMGELVPSEGPAKSKIMGQQTAMQQERARRVETYLNHEMMFVDDSWYMETSRTFFAVPYQGCAFKKVYRDRALGRNTSIFVSAEDFIAPPTISDLKSAPRYAHRIWRTRNELRKAMVSGEYRDVELREPGFEDLPEETQLRLESVDLQAEEDREDARHELFESYIELDLQGFEDADEIGPTGVALPYVVTVDKESRKILSIYRGWKQQDPLKRRRVNFVKYGYIPGLAFYDFGLFHLMGGLQEAATGALRELLDAGATASLQGGFVAKDANIRDEKLEIEPGVWKPVDATAEDLQKAFFTPPFKEPSPALFQLLSFLTERAEKFTATTELMTGDTNAKAPVGSVTAVIEQAAKVFSTIHRGLHMSMAQELRLRFELVQEHMPEEGYPYDVEGQHEGILAEDFAPGVSITPVSDPNIFSSTQRVSIAQAVYQLAMENPDIIKKDVAVRRVMEAIRVPDVDELFIANDPPPAPEPMDPVSEVQALLRGQPVQAYPDQNHIAYLQHYASFLNNPEYGGNPEIQKAIGPAAMALVGQRLAYAWATHARSLGAAAPLLPPPLGAPDPSQGAAAGAAPMGGPGVPQLPPPGGMQGQIMPPMGGQMGGPPMQGEMPIAPPEVIAQMAAQIAPQMQQVPGLPAIGAEGDDGTAAAKMAEVEIKRVESDQKMELERFKAQQKASTDQMMAAIKAEESKRKMEFEAFKVQQKAEADRAMNEVKVSATLADAQASQQERQLGMQQTVADGETNRRIVEQDAMTRQAEVGANQRRAEEESRFDRSLRKTESDRSSVLAEKESATKQEVAKKRAAKPAAKPKGKK